MAATGITRVLPDLTDDLLLNLFHKGVKAQWTSRDLDWVAAETAWRPPAPGGRAAADGGC